MRQYFSVEEDDRSLTVIGRIGRRLDSGSGSATGKLGIFIVLNGSSYFRDDFSNAVSDKLFGCGDTFGLSRSRRFHVLSRSGRWRVKYGKM
mmetsp:Transcript_28464/g.51915  ORF Transcript_28464/g.51915 Transcript_28464/m.51915 type:complete len:91 (-) Transcript_28464:259-531(-)